MCHVLFEWPIKFMDYLLSKSVESKMFWQLENNFPFPCALFNLRDDNLYLRSLEDAILYKKFSLETKIVLKSLMLYYSFLIKQQFMKKIIVKDYIVVQNF